MSTVMRPRGPLPPRIYWTRRLLIVAIVAVVVALLWWLMAGGRSGSAAADQQPSHPAGQQTPKVQPPTTPSPGSGSTPTGSHQTGQPPAHTRPPAHHPKVTTDPTPQAVPTGACDPARISLAVVAEDAPAGAGTTVGLTMSTTDDSTCTLGVSPSLLEARLSSAKGVVWASTSCPDGLAAKNVVVGPTPATVYSFDWDGKVSPDACTSKGSVAQPGDYSAEAALIGGEPATAHFVVTDPADPASSKTGAPLH